MLKNEKTWQPNYFLKKLVLDVSVKEEILIVQISAKKLYDTDHLWLVFFVWGDQSFIAEYYYCIR